MSDSTLTVRVTRRTAEAIDIDTFELVDVGGKPLPPFSAGSHIDVEVPNGVTRQYSLCNDPTESHRYLIGVLRDAGSRGGSVAMHEQVKEGDVLRISTPKNHFPLAHGAARSVLLAGGIGVTPILCMAERLAMAGADFEMHYCTRSRERTAFHGRIARSAFAPRVRFHFDDGPQEQKLDIAALRRDRRRRTFIFTCADPRVSWTRCSAPRARADGPSPSCTTSSSRRKSCARARKPSRSSSRARAAS